METNVIRPPAQTKKRGTQQSQVPHSIARSTKDRALFLVDSPINRRLAKTLGSISVDQPWSAALFRLIPEAQAASAMLIVRQKALVKSWCEFGVDLVTQLSGSPCRPSRLGSEPSCRTFAAPSRGCRSSGSRWSKRAPLRWR